MDQLPTAHIRSTDDKGPAILGVTLIFLVLTWIAVSLRFYSRIAITRTVGGDDWVMLFALILFTVYNGFIFSEVSNGAGKHLEDVNMAKARRVVAASWFAELAYILTTTIARVSIAWFLLRIAVNKCHIRVLLVTSFATVSFNIFLFFYALFQCTPVSYYWTRVTHLSEGHCIPMQHSVDATFAGSASSAAADLVYASIPVAMLWHVQIERKSKIALAVILGMGAASVIAVIVRSAYVNELKAADFLYQTANLTIWSGVEPGLGITAGSLATLRPLLRKFQHKRRTPIDHDSIHTTDARHWETPEQTPPQTGNLQLGVTKPLQSVIRYDKGSWPLECEWGRQINAGGM